MRCRLLLRRETACDDISPISPCPPVVHPKQDDRTPPATPVRPRSPGRLCPAYTAAAFPCCFAARTALFARSNRSLRDPLVCRKACQHERLTGSVNPIGRAISGADGLPLHRHRSRHGSATRIRALLLPAGRSPRGRARSHRGRAGRGLLPGTPALHRLQRRNVHRRVPHRRRDRATAELHHR